MPPQPTSVSVTSPISPAIDRVKRQLFQPFDAGKWFVVGFCAWLAHLGENGGGTGFNWSSGHHGGGGGNFRHELQHAKEYGFDVNRLAVTGDSAGGHLALTTGMLPASAGLDRQCPGPDNLKVAAMLKLNQQTVRNWIDQGSLPALRVGRRVRIRRSDLERVLEKSSTVGTARPNESKGDDTAENCEQVTSAP